MRLSQTKTAIARRRMRREETSKEKETLLAKRRASMKRWNDMQRGVLSKLSK